MTLASLGATRDYEDSIRATLAQRIIALAEAGERDPERLYESALRTISPSDASGPRHLAEAVQPPEIINVRFGPLCGLKSDISRRPRSARNGREQSQQGSPYSITHQRGRAQLVRQRSAYDDLTNLDLW